MDIIAVRLYFMIEVIENIRYNVNACFQEKVLKNNRIQERGEGMEDTKRCGLEALEKTTEISEFKWYIFDIINEGLEQDGIEKSKFSLDKKKADAVCFTVGAGSFSICGKGGEAVKQHHNIYHAVCDFFNRIYENEENTENAVTRFLIRTLDLPALMKKPSRSMLRDQINKCQEEIDALEEKMQKEPGKKEETMLSLNKVYLKGLKEKMERNFGETI
ncbi:hypothetical protein H171_1360 [[Clostridium] celerecrescens 18A]|uniref:Uncharacterized protein n=2 Tax=Lacrimispora celerecrescens TaxID=29354 RepID=A0A2M8Z374_9FIRM|nr:hypothetical protein H171_1360 [[Clostridium] celerecrescens 18A]